MKAKNRFSGAIKAAAVSAAVASSTLVLSAGSIAHAGEYGVRVIDDTGMPVEGASVCFGLPGSYRQFGAYFTDSDGQAITEVPNIPFVVTVSKTRFSGVRLTEPARGFNLIKQVTLSEGTPGPRCKAGSTLADANQSPIRVTRLQVGLEGDTTLIEATTTGEPTEYRVSDSPELENLSWETLDDPIRVTGALADRAELFLQLRRYEGTTDGWIEARSDVVTVFVPATNSQL